MQYDSFNLQKIAAESIKLNKKIDLANEDNCGPCGEYILEKLKITANKVKVKSNINENKSQ